LVGSQDGEPKGPTEGPCLEELFVHRERILSFRRGRI
jgi:hypothetical protein